MSTQRVVLLKAVQRQSPTKEIGAPGLKDFGGFLQEEFLTDLRGQQGALRYREMVDNCPAIDAALTTLKNVSLRAIQDGRVEPWEGKGGEDRKRAEFVEQAFEDMAHSRMAMDLDALTMYEYGYAPLEIVYKRRAGYKREEGISSRFDDELVGWSKICLRAQESVHQWLFDEEGRKCLAMVQLPAPTYRGFTIPIDRLALFRTTSLKGNPEGRSLLRSCYFAWKFFKRGTTMAWVGAERDVTGIPVLKGPAELFAASPTTDAAAALSRLKSIGENVRNDEQACILLPSDVDPETKVPLYTFELVASPGTKVMDLPAMTRDQERQILMVLFSDFLLMGHEKIGTQALFSGRMNLYAMQLDALLDRYDEVINRQLIPRLGLFNGWPMEQLPTFKHGRVSETAMAELGAFLQQYAGAGGMLDPNLDAYIREQVGWPEQEEDWTLAPSKPVVPPVPPPVPGQEEEDKPGAALAEGEAEDEAEEVDEAEGEEKKPEVTE